MTASIGYSPPGPIPFTQLIHVRKTVTFDGTAGNGAVGTVSLFTITGRVLLVYATSFATVTLQEGAATATIRCGTTGNLTALFRQINATALVADRFWGDATPATSETMDLAAAAYTSAVMLSENILITVGAQAVTAGSIIVDVWYLPITDDGALVAA